MALFHAKFACILVISNPVFRWESCKGSVWESVKNCLRLCKETETCGWISRVAHGLQAARMLHTCQTCQKLKSRTSYCTTGQKSQAGQAVCSRLELATQPSHEVKSSEHPVWEKLTFHIPSHPTIYIPLYPQFWESFQRKFWERNPKEKQDWLIHNLYLRDSSNSSTLFFSIIKSLRGLLPKPFSHHIHFCERAVWCFGKQLGRNQFHIGWCYGQVAESGKLEKK